VKPDVTHGNEVVKNFGLIKIKRESFATFIFNEQKIMVSFFYGAKDILEGISCLNLY
jgi:hypothetical protein